MGNELQRLWNNARPARPHPAAASQFESRKEMPSMNLLASNSLHRLRTRIAVFAITTVAALGASTAVQAQGMRGGMASLFVPDFLPRDLPVFVDSLGLEEWQRPILEALLEDYGTNFATAADGIRASMGQLRESPNAANPEKIVEMISKPLIAWGEEKKKLRADLLESVKSQLSDVQIESWPKLERALRREKALPNGEISGESVNLVLITREIDAPPVLIDNARAAIEEYEVKLDEALAAREVELEATIAPMLSAMGSNDSDRLVATQERVMQKRVAVRQIQEAGRDAIREALGADYGPNFEKRALRRGYPQVYGPDPVTPLFEAAMTLPDLTEEQKAKITALRAKFDGEHGTLQGRYKKAVSDFEPREPRRRAEALALKALGEAPKSTESPEIDSIKTERQELYTRFRGALAEILTDNQKEAVPGFGKPGAELAPGQKYSDATRNPKGVEGGKQPAASPTDGNQPIDPSRKPSPGGKPTMNDIRPGGSQPNQSPKQTID